MGKFFKILQSTFIRPLNEPENTFIKFILFCFVILFYYLSLNIYLSDSEIWSVGSNLILGENSYSSFSFLSKFLFNTILQIVHIFVPNSSPLMVLYFRVFFASIMLINVYIYLKIYKQLFPQLNSIFLFLFLTSNSLFLLRGFRIRADFLIILFAGLALIKFFSYQRTGRKIDLFLSIAFLFLVCLVSVKGVPIALGLIAFCYIIDNEKWSEKFKQILGPFGVSVFVSILIMYFKFPDFIPSLYKYIINAFGSDPDELEYLSKKSFYYLIKFISWNPVWFILAGIGSFYGLFKKNPKIIRSYSLLSVLFFTYFVLFPEKLPYYLLVFVFFWAPLAVFYLHRLIHLLPVKFKNGISSLIVLALIVKVIIFSTIFLKTNNNFKQVEVIKKLDDYFSNYDEIKIFDNIGILPNRADELFFLGPNQKIKNRQMVEGIKVKFPDVIICANKCLFSKDLMSWIRSNYLDLLEGLYFKNKKIKLTEKNTEAFNLKTKTFYLISFANLLELFRFEYNEKAEFFIKKDKFPVKSYYLKDVDDKLNLIDGHILNFRLVDLYGDKLAIKKDSLPFEIHLKNWPKIDIEPKPNLLSIFTHDL